MALPHRIGLAGRMGVGKTTVARLLEFHHRYARLAFGDELRRMIGPAYGAVQKDEIYTINGRDLTGRELLQVSGRLLRSLDSEIFLRAMLRGIAIYPETTPLVVDDVRMPQEADFLRQHGFEIYILEADSATRENRVGGGWAGLDDETEAISFEAPRINTSGIAPEEVIRIIAEERRG